MTNEEAIEILKKNHCYDKCDDCLWFQDSSECEVAMAIEALEKQIPKKVTNQEGYYFPPCPSCGRKSAFVGENNYCEVCGQRLDWGDKDD